MINNNDKEIWNLRLFCNKLVICRYRFSSPEIVQMQKKPPVKFLLTVWREEMMNFIELKFTSKNIIFQDYYQ